MAQVNALTVVFLCISSSALTYLGMEYMVRHRPPSTVVVPSVVGLSVDQARRLTDNAGLLLTLDGERAPEGEPVTPGNVLEQKPLGGSRVHGGESVHATLALAVQSFKVPQVVDQPLASARQALEQAGLKVGSVTEVASEKGQPGNVTESRPPAGADVKKGATVDLTVAKAGEIVVPKLRGMRPAGARTALEKVGLVLGEKSKGVDDNAEDGVILRQNPAAGTNVARGSKVDITVNQ